jgi:hypothetical protein
MMRLTLSEMKIPLSGAGVALAAGLLLGGAMQPHLYDGDRPSGPQMFANRAGARSTGPFDPGTTFASSQGQMPDYVMGTDWKNRMTSPDERAAVSTPRREPAADDVSRAEAPPTFTRAAYDEFPPPAHVYPSMGGAHPSVIEVPAEAEADTAAPTIRG